MWKIEFTKQLGVELIYILHRGERESVWEGGERGEPWWLIKGTEQMKCAAMCAEGQLALAQFPPAFCLCFYSSLWTSISHIVTSILWAAVVLAQGVCVFCHCVSCGQIVLLLLNGLSACRTCDVFAKGRWKFFACVWLCTREETKKKSFYLCMGVCMYAVRTGVYWCVCVCAGCVISAVCALIAC